MTEMTGGWVRGVKVVVELEGHMVGDGASDRCVESCTDDVFAPFFSVFVYLS